MGRFIAAGLIAAVIVAGLFFGMRAMVTQTAAPPAVPTKIETIVVTPKDDRRRNDELEPTLPEAPPPAPPLQPTLSDPTNSEQSTSLPKRFDIDPPVPTGDNPAIAVVRIEPDYPPELVGRVAEPVTVTVSFDVSASGAVENVRVIGVEPPDAPKGFEREAIRAVERFRYRPQTDEAGKPVATRNIQLAIRFEPLAK